MTSAQSILSLLKAHTSVQIMLYSSSATASNHYFHHQRLDRVLARRTVRFEGLPSDERLFTCSCTP